MSNANAGPPQTGLEKRFCPKCGHAARGRADQFAGRVRCPNCKQDVRYFDYPNEPPKPPPSPRTDQTLFVVLLAAIGLAAVVTFVALILIVAGHGFTAAFLALIVLLAGILMIIVAIERHNHAIQCRVKAEHADEVKQSLLEAIDKWTGFERNYQKIVTERTMVLDNAGATAQAAWQRKMDEVNAKIQEVSEHHAAVQTVAEKYLKELVAWVTRNVTSNNFATSKSRIEKAIEFCRRKGAVVTEQTEKEIYLDLRARFEEVVRKEAAREEQQRIKERIREEQKAQAEIDRELKRMEAERIAIQQAIALALARTQDEHSAEVEELRRRLTEAEAQSARALSMAQQTKAGHVYVISNIGSFGQDVFKIGMTRRLEPMNRVRELGDASVPFAFDVHMMISCDDAPSLENALHKKLNPKRLNRVNHRKEFFRTTIDEIRQIVEKHHGTVDYVAEPEALEYYESQTLSGEDLDFVESVLDTYQDDDDERMDPATVAGQTGRTGSASKS